MPSDRFQDAAAYLSSASSLTKVSNDIKLELYALFKCISVSNTPPAPRPSLFDFTGRVKWDAWDKLGKQNSGKHSQDLEARYIEIAQFLGWQNGIDRNPLGETELRTDGESAQAMTGEGGGMGVHVSAMPQPPVDPKDEGTLHGFALSNNAEGLSLFWDAHPDTDINSLDDYGYTPLHLAADRGHSGIVKVLIGRGADTSIQDPDGLTALALAEVGGHDDIMNMIQGDALP